MVRNNNTIIHFKTNRTKIIFKNIKVQTFNFDLWTVSLFCNDSKACHIQLVTFFNKADMFLDRVNTVLHKYHHNIFQYSDDHVKTRNRQRKHENRLNYFM